MSESQSQLKNGFSTMPTAMNVGYYLLKLVEKQREDISFVSAARTVGWLLNGALCLWVAFSHIHRTNYEGNYNIQGNLLLRAKLNTVNTLPQRQCRNKCW